MTLLEVVAKAAGGNEEVGNKEATPSKFPLPFHPDLILPKLKPEPRSDNRFSLVEPVNGFQISNSNSAAVADANTRLLNKLKSSSSSSANGFTELIVSSLKQIASKAGVSVEDEDAANLIVSVGDFLSRDVIQALIDACVSLEIWGILETLISSKLVGGFQSQLLSKLIAKSRSDLICACVRSFSDDLNWSDLLLVLRYFLSPTKEGRLTMASVRKSWEDEALLAVKLAGEKSKKKQGKAAKEAAAILLMVAYDGFSSSELCLHYLLSSTKAAGDDIVFSGAISKLSLEEVLCLIRYLSKWLSKYESFPQAIPCPESKACVWVPSVEIVAEALAVVLDEWFSTLVLHSKFHQELKSVERVVASLVLQGRLCGPVACLIEIAKAEGDVAS